MIPAFLMVLRLFHMRAIRSDAPRWVFYWLAFLICIVANPIIVLFVSGLFVYWELPPIPLMGLAMVSGMVGGAAAVYLNR